MLVVGVDPNLMGYWWLVVNGRGCKLWGGGVF